ncbi:hypothetical protein GEMRC1_005660 [Eukaryota sp. GEM-RC1]
MLLLHYHRSFRKPINHRRLSILLGLLLFVSLFTCLFLFSESFSVSLILPADSVKTTAYPTYASRHPTPSVSRDTMDPLQSHSQYKTEFSNSRENFMSTFLLPGKKAFNKRGIDAVITYVNGGDPVWQEQRHTKESATINSQTPPQRYPDNPSSSDKHASEFSDIGEIVFSLRGVYKNLPDLRHVFLVVSGPTQIPSWLDPGNPYITIVYHEDIFEDVSVLPVFSSYAIEANLWRIPGLSQNFLYFNDDMALVKPLPTSLLYDLQTGRRLIHIEHQRVIQPPGDNQFIKGLLQSSGILSKTFGRPEPKLKCWHAMAHTWYPLNRKVMQEAATEFAETFQKIVSTPFRPPDGLPHFVHLANHYWVQKSIRTDYKIPLYNAMYHYCYQDEFVFDHLGQRKSVETLFKRIEKPKCFSICLNDPGYRNPPSVEMYYEKMTVILPERAPWETIDAVELYRQR